MSLFFRLLPYLLAVGTIAAAAVDLYQKREDYKNKRLRQIVIALFILTAVLTIFGLYHDNAEKDTEKQEADKTNKSLQAKVDAANNAQKDNTAVFLQQFKDLSGEVGDLKTQVKTDALQKKLDSVQDELLKTQKAMAPAPKADLEFTFVPFKNPIAPFPMVPSKVVELPVDPDGSVHVDFSVINGTDVTAKDVQITLVICDQCKFAKEVEIYAGGGTQGATSKFEKMPGEWDTHRYIFFPQIQSASYLPTAQVDIIPPPLAAEFMVGIMPRCSTCVPVRGGNYGTVHVKR
jgi:hypothetical protein